MLTYDPPVYEDRAPDTELHTLVQGMQVREVADTRIVIALIDQLHTLTEIGASTDGQSPHEALRSVPIATSKSRCHPSVDPLDASHSWPGILYTWLGYSHTLPVILNLLSR